MTLEEHASAMCLEVAFLIAEHGYVSEQAITKMVWDREHARYGSLLWATHGKLLAAGFAFDRKGVVANGFAYPQEGVWHVWSPGSIHVHEPKIATP